MNLYIKSQDEWTTKEVAMTDIITIVDYTSLKENVNQSGGWGIVVDECIVGVYKTKERALEILNEIYKIIIGNRTIESCALAGTMNNCQDFDYESFYEMPKE